MKEYHPDFSELAPIADEVVSRFGGEAALQNRFPEMVSEAVDYVIDPVRTGRTKIVELDNVEKTFIGLKVEHFLRDELEVPSGLRDLRIRDRDVDVKNTVRNTWMIPPETFNNADPCVLIMIATDQGACSCGLFLAKKDYLTKPNRDGKRGVSRASFDNILWLVNEVPMPPSRYIDIDMARFRELREMRGGTKRAAQFFKENLRKVIHRDVVSSLLHDQKDYMKRLRGNGGARDKLAEDGILLLSGKYDSAQITRRKLPDCDNSEFIAVQAASASLD